MLNLTVKIKQHFGVNHQSTVTASCPKQISQQMRTINSYIIILYNRTSHNRNTELLLKCSRVVFGNDSKQARILIK